MPYQRLARSGNILIAARGSSVDSFNLQDGSLLSTWMNASPAKPSLLSPPTKKRKLSKDEDGRQKEEPQENGKNQNGFASFNEEKKKQNNRLDAVASGLEFPAIIALLVTEDGRHVIAATAEDKSIRVFENILGEGGKQQLVQISLRQMPKRPCAIALTTDSLTIISADKFGDVYSLPLFPLSTSSTSSPETPETPETTVVPTVFVPAANELTIHSKRNLKALQNQRRQTNATPEKKADFAGTLLLGHVSMLTDLVLGKFGDKSYILTADRDEHIRVSRGIPQSHVIEGYCLGHQEFVTRLCVPRCREGLLISGGGDDEIYVWEWLTGKLAEKVDLKSHVMALMEGLSSGKEVKGSEGQTGITLSGIFSQIGLLDLVIVTCEGIPGLFIFQLSSQNHLEHLQTILLKGNALDVLTNIPQSNRLVVSVDTVHNSGSTTEHRNKLQNPVEPFQVFEIRHDGKVVETADLAFAARGETEEGRGREGNLTNLLYSLKNLRKREGEDKED